MASAEGARSRRRRRRGRWGVGRGFPPFSIFELKKASFGAFWVLFFEVELNGNWCRPLSGMY